MTSSAILAIAMVAAMSPVIFYVLRGAGVWLVTGKLIDPWSEEPRKAEGESHE